MPKLSQFQRAAIIGKLQRGKMKAAIAREMDVTKSCVTKIARKVARPGPERSLKNSPGGKQAPQVKPSGCGENCQWNQEGALLIIPVLIQKLSI